MYSLLMKYQIYDILMLNDESLEVRQKGWRKVLQARKNRTTNSVRRFKIPELYFNCTSYLDLIDIDNAIDTNQPKFRDIDVNGVNIDELASQKMLDQEFGEFR